jgi:prepilin-type N-terminal cleavage/methylation domain-containing protein
VRSRVAFTLVEMLVVIAVIGILAALTAAGVYKVIGVQRSSNTKSTMASVYRVLQEHWQAVIADARKETGLEIPFQQIDTLFGPAGANIDRNRIIWIKMRLMEAFPISYLDVQRPFPYDYNIIPATLRKYNDGYKKTLGARVKDNKGGATESAACLLMALSVARNGVALNIDNLGTSNVTDTDNDGMQEIVDAWGSPLAFFRFPTDNPLLQNAAPAAGNKKSPSFFNADPLDPTGALFTILQNGNATQKANYESRVHKLRSPVTQGAGYILPTIVSAGPDGVLGLDTSIPNNMKIVAPQFADDNVYSFQLN